MNAHGLVEVEERDVRLHNFDDDLKRRAIVASLRQRGLGKLCQGEKTSFTLRANRMSYVLMGGILLGVAFSISDWLNANEWQTVAIGSMLAVILGLVASISTVKRAAFLLGLFWIGAIVTQAVKDDQDVLATIAVPFAVSFSAVSLASAKRFMHLARTAPLAFPIILSALIIPLFTGELWAAMESTSVANIAFAGGLVLLPLAVAVTASLRASVARLNFPTDLEEGWVEHVATELSSHSDDDDQRESAAEQVKTCLTEHVDQSTIATCRDQVVTALHRRMRITVAASCLVLCGITFATILLFGWLLVPASSVEGWIAVAVPHYSGNVIGIDFNAPLGVYLKIAGLLGILATAVLMASVAVDESHADRFAAAVLEKRVTEALPFVVAHRQLADARGSNGDTG